MNNTIRIIIAGDLLPSEDNFTLFEQGNIKELFGEQICKLFAGADFSIANLEGPLTDSSKGMDKIGPVLKAPMNTVTGIKGLGISALALANNHITDYLQRGYTDTIETLDKAGIGHVGAGPDIDHVHKYLSLEIKGKKICIYNVSETFFNRPTKTEAGANLYDEWVVLNEIKTLRKCHDFLAVIYHGGAEYFPYTTPQTRLRFHRMAECGADFITAQHTHCIGCEEYYKGSYLLFGQGNFLFARQKKYQQLTKEGLLSEIVLSPDGFTVKNHLIKIKDSIIRYDPEQDLSSFHERGKLLDNEDAVISLFKQIKSEEIMDKFLISFKGSFPLQRVIKRLFPKSFLSQGLMDSYSKTQCLRNMNVVQSERRSEDMFYVWHHVIENQSKKV